MDKVSQRNEINLEYIQEQLWWLSWEELIRVSEFIDWLKTNNQQQILWAEGVINDTVEKINEWIDLSKFNLPINEANKLMDKLGLKYWERAIAVYELHKAILNKFIEKSDIDNAELYVDTKIIPFFEVLLEDWILDSQLVNSICNEFKSKKFLEVRPGNLDRVPPIYSHNKNFVLNDSDNIELVNYLTSGIWDLIKWYIGRWDWSAAWIWLLSNNNLLDNN